MISSFSAPPLSASTTAPFSAWLGDDGLLQDASTSDVDGQEGNDHMTTMQTSEPEAPIADATRMFF